MKKIMMLGAALSLSLIFAAGVSHAADSNMPRQKNGILGTRAHVVPDISGPSASVKGDTFETKRQGYANIPTYKVVDDRDKPITNDWARPQSWRIGYKNKNRTPIND